MQTSDGKVSRVLGSLLTRSNVSTIQLFCNIAKAKNAPLSLRELLSLTSLDMTEDELHQAWQKCAILNNGYSITQGVITEKNDVLKKAASDRAERLARASSNMSYATKFNTLLGDNDLKALAISGSTSYMSVSREDDLDFFFVTRKDTMWISLGRALLVARLFKLKERNAPSLCLSFVADEKFTEEQFANNHDGLIARDAISARIIRGESYYNHMLRRSEWIAEYFPKLYELRFGSLNDPSYSPETQSLSDTSTVKKIANMFLYYAVGTYIRMKSNLLNRKLTKMGKKSSIFKLRVGKDHCIYESASYRELRKMYSQLEHK